MPDDRAARRGKKRAKIKTPESGGGRRPRWVPAGVDFGGLPPQTRQAIVEIVNPAYEQLVLAATEALERSTGLSIVHMLWLEILGEVHLNTSFSDDPLIQSIGNGDTLLARHMQIVDTKIKATYVLVRLREFRQEWGRAQAMLPRLPAPAGIPGGTGSGSREEAAVLGVIVEPPSGDKNVAKTGFR